MDAAADMHITEEITVVFIGGQSSLLALIVFYTMIY